MLFFTVCISKSLISLKKHNYVNHLTHPCLVTLRVKENHYLPGHSIRKQNILTHISSKEGRIPKQALAALPVGMVGFILSKD
jgi:hypothetical protein